MNFPCPNPPVDCPGVNNNPLTNFSSEAPDAFSYLGEFYGPNADAPLGWTGEPTPLYRTCTSTVSQAAANACAESLAVPNWIPPSQQPNPNPPVFGNDSLFGVSSCPDGTQFQYLVPQNQFRAGSREAANEAAQDWGNQQAEIHKLCLSDLPGVICQGAALSLAITPTSAFLAPPGANNWTIIDGALPPGLSLSNPDTGPAMLTGTPTTVGDYQFTVHLILTNGDFTQKQYFMTVAGFAGTLPEATAGTPYNVSLDTFVGGFSMPSFDDSAGPFPAGLTMDRSGNVSGTPTTGGTTIVNLRIEDGVTGFVCNQVVSFTVNATCGPLPVQQFGPTVVGSVRATLLARPGIALSPDLLAVGQFGGGSDVTTINPHTLATASISIPGVADVACGCYSAVNDRFIFGHSTGGVCRISRVAPDPLSVQSTTDFSATLGSAAFYMVYHSVKKLVYGVSRGHIFAYDPVTNTITGSVLTVVLNDNPQITIDETNNILWACNENAAPFSLYKYDISGAVPVLINTYAFPASAGGNPSIAFCPGNSLVYCAYYDLAFATKMARFNPATGLFGNITATANIPNFYPYPFSYNPVSKLLFVQDVGNVDVYCSVTDSLLGTLTPGMNQPSPSAFGAWDASNSFVDSQVNPSTLTLYH
jgi:hypothetical protein